MTNICDIYIDLNNLDVYKITGYSELCRSISLVDNKGNQFNKHIDVLFDFEGRKHEIASYETSEYKIIKDVCEAGHDFIAWAGEVNKDGDVGKDLNSVKAGLESTFNNWLNNTKKYVNVYIFSQDYIFNDANKNIHLSTKYFFKNKEGVKDV